MSRRKNAPALVQYVSSATLLAALGTKLSATTARPSPSQDLACQKESSVRLARMERRPEEEETCNTSTPATESWTSTGA